MIRTPRLLLRSWQADDEPVLRRLLLEPEVREYLGGPVAHDEVAGRVADEVAGRDGSYAMVDHEGTVVGWVRLDVRPGDREAEVSWLVLPEHRDLGFATEGARAATGLAWRSPAVDHVVAITQEANAPSRQVAGRLGMVEQARFVRFDARQMAYELPRPDPTHRVPGLLDRLRAWAGAAEDVEALALAGSWARGRGRPDSDVDLVALVDDVEPWLASTRWIGDVGEWHSVVDEDWGPVQSRRVDHGGGLEVEYGVTTRAWATPPLDAGTAQVVRAGLRGLHDPEGLLAGARTWCDEHQAGPS